MTSLDINELASSTMQAVCAVRDRNKDILGEDPVSKELIGYLPRADEWRSKLDEASHGMFSRSVVIRTQFFLEVLKKYTNQSEQLVVLSSGLDFKYLRFDKWRQKRVFMVDQPASLSLMLRAVEMSKTDLSHVEAVSLDIETMSQTDLMDKLVAKGFDVKKPTLILWEGATYYIRDSAVFGALNAVFSACLSVTVAADFVNKYCYLAQSSLSTDNIDEGVTDTLDILSQHREPWKGFFSESGLSEFLADKGCESIDFCWDSDLESRYLGSSDMSIKTMFYMVANKVP